MPHGRPIAVTVAILTYRRPQELATGLPHVAAQAADVGRAGAEFDLDVLVVDNDPIGSARAVVADLQGERVRYVIEPQPGISAGRNRALDESARSDLLIFIDDDERPDPDWLKTLLSCWTATSATAVVGRVVSELPAKVDPWVRAGRFFTRPVRTAGSSMRAAATNNTLIDLRYVRQHDLRFDPTLGLSGGEDNLFTRQLVASGGQIVWCEDAVVVDRVPPERTTRRFLLARSWSHGNTSVVVDLRMAADPLDRLRVRGASYVRGLVRIVGGTGRFALGVVVRSAWHQARGLRTALRGAGMIAGCLGVVYQEYSREDRRLVGPAR